MKATSLKDTSPARPASASALACSALGLQPLGTPHEGDAKCCDLCGTTITKGRLRQPNTPSKSFFDFNHFPARASGLVCGHCAAVTPQPKLRFLQRCVVTADAIYDLGTDAYRAGFWLQPPKPPFVVVLNDKSMATYHYLWRTPVTLDDRLVSLNSDDVVYRVNRPKVLAALDAAKALAETCQRVAVDNADLAKLSKGKTNSPFTVLFRAPNTVPRTSGQLARWVSRLMETLDTHEQTRARPCVDLLASCDAGELLALSSFLKSKPVAPEPPPALVVRGKATAAMASKKARQAELAAANA